MHTYAHDNQHWLCILFSNLDGCSPQQRKLYTQLLGLLKDGHLAKLACEDVSCCIFKYTVHSYMHFSSFFVIPHI